MSENLIKTAVDKSPETYNLLTYAWVVGLSSLGGFVAFARKVKQGHARAWNFAEFFGEIATSAFAGIITFYLCQAGNISQLATAAFVGIAGHAGSRAIFLLERFIESRFISAMPPHTHQRDGDQDEKL